MQNPLNSLINSIIPNANEEIKNKLSELISETIVDPKNGFKKYLLKTLVSEFKEKNSSESSTFSEILKKHFNLTDEQYEVLRKKGLDVIDLFVTDNKTVNGLGDALKATPFSVLEVYAAVAQAVLKYGLDKNIKDVFNSENKTQEMSQLVMSLVEVQKETKQKLSGAEFVEYLCEILRLFLTHKGSNKADSILTLLNNDEFKKFLASTNEFGELNLAHLRKPTLEDITDIFKVFATKLTKPAYNFNLYVGLATDLTVLGISCVLVKTLEQLEGLLGKNPLFKTHIESVKNNNKDSCFVVYSYEVNDVYGVVVLHQVNGGNWLVVENKVLNNTDNVIVKTELYDLISSQICEQILSKLNAN